MTCARATWRSSTTQIARNRVLSALMTHRQRRLPRPDTVRPGFEVLRSEERPGQSALAAGGRALQAQAQAHHHAGRAQGQPDQLDGFLLTRRGNRLSVMPVSEAALADHPVAGVGLRGPYREVLQDSSAAEPAPHREPRCVSRRTGRVARDLQARSRVPARPDEHADRLGSRSRLAIAWIATHRRRTCSSCRGCGSAPRKCTRC